MKLLPLIGPRGWIFGMPGPAGRGAGMPAGYFNGGWARYDWQNPADFIDLPLDEQLSDAVRLSALSSALFAFGSEARARLSESERPWRFARAMLNPCITVDVGEIHAHDLLLGFGYQSRGRSSLLIGTTDYLDAIGATLIRGDGRWVIRHGPSSDRRGGLAIADAISFASDAFEEWVRIERDRAAGMR